MNKKVSLLLVLVLVLGLFAGCSSSGNKKVEDNQEPKGESTDTADTIKIGANFALSGQVATYGQSAVNGIELAMEEINKNGGVLGKQLELVKADNKSDPTESTNVTTKLVTKDKVVVVLGSDTSGNTKAAIPPAMQNKVPIISPSATADDVTVDSSGKVKDFVFKTCFSDSFQGVIMGTFAYNELNTKNAAVLIDNTSDYSHGLAESFKETFTNLGGNIVAEEAYQSKEKDFKAVLTKIKGTSPDVLYLPGYYEEVGLIVKQARELGLDVPVLGGDGYDSPKLTEIAGSGALNKVYFTNHYSSQDTTQEVVKFREVYKAKYGKDPDAFNALGYDLMYLVADAIERAGEADSVKIKDTLAQTKGFKGVTGELSIDENHNPVKSVTILEMKNGEQIFVKKLMP